MIFIQPDIHIYYMPHRTFRLISQMYDVTVSCLVYFIYFNEIKKFKSRKHNDWLIATHNAYYDLCVLHWCMLFGEKNTEKTHFYCLTEQQYNLASNFNQLNIAPLSNARLSEHILKKSNINKKIFSKFRKDILLYRNKNLIHREHDPDLFPDGWINRPLTKKIMQSAFSLYELIIELAATFPSNLSDANRFRLDCCVFKNSKMLTQYYLNTFPSLEK